MGTRILCFVIAVFFLISTLGIVGIVVYEHVSNPSESSPKTAEEIEQERLDKLENLGQLTDFKPLTNPVSKFEIKDLKDGEGELEIIENDIIDYKADYALAKTGQIIFQTPTQSTETDEEESSTTGLKRLTPEELKDNIIGLKPGAKRRFLIPASKVSDYLEDGTLPAGYDLVIDFEITGIADRLLEGFEPLTEGLEELKIEDLKDGDGSTIQQGATILVNYIGVLANNGEVFDVGQAELGLDNVIEGWQQGMLGLKEGGKRRIFIPAELGYGEQGSGETIPPNSDLVFEVELLEIIK